MSNLNKLLGFNKGSGNSSTKNTGTPLTGSGNQTNLQKALQLLAIQRGVQQAVAGFSPQARIIGVLAVTLVVGLPLNAFISNPTSQIGFMIFFSLSILAIVWGLMETAQLKWGMLVAWATGTAFWIYIFYERIKQRRIEDKVGKRAYICNPFGECANDGWSGTYNGVYKYLYTSPKPDPKSGIRKQLPFIPGRLFQNKDPNSYTYSFWLKVSYLQWKSERFTSGPSPVIVKGGTLDTASPSVWLDEKTNVIQFQGDPPMGPDPLVIALNYPFDQWVHYVLVVHQDAMEVYVNGLLEKTKVLTHPLTINKSNLYVGTTPPNALSFDEGEMPAEMVYLLYYNKSLTAGEVDDLYKDQLLQMRRIPPSSGDKDGGDTPSDKHCEECPQDCTPKKQGQDVPHKSYIQSTLEKLGITGDKDDKSKTTAPQINTTTYHPQNALSTKVQKYLKGDKTDHKILGFELFSNPPRDILSAHLNKTSNLIGGFDSLAASVNNSAHF
jgi:hypothetical protein